MMLLFKIYKAIISRIYRVSSLITCKIKFELNGIVYSTFRTTGCPYIVKDKTGSITIGEDFAMNNGIVGNPIGCYERCTFFVAPNCKIVIGKHVGISQTALISYATIIIGDNVKIGGGTCLWTTDFHSLDPEIRSSLNDLEHRKCLPIIVEDNVFIGAKVIILKGVTIGRNSIIGAGSVVTKSIPPNEIWAGNPAKFIRKI